MSLDFLYVTSYVYAASVRAHRWILAAAIAGSWVLGPRIVDRTVIVGHQRESSTPQVLTEPGDSKDGR